VNSTNFLKVLTGDAKGMRGIGSGRVIKRFEFSYLLNSLLQLISVTGFFLALFFEKKLNLLCIL
jgi:hypothetical protein